jgi:Family of unknown function (DUF6169)
MQANNTNPYDFISFKDENNTYAFVTDQLVVYEVKFKASNYIFSEYSSTIHNTYEFVIEVAENPSSKQPSLDERIPSTISLIFQDFFTLKETVVVYICDDSDSRGRARNRKFNQWFEQYNPLTFMKLDFAFGSGEDKYFTTLIMRLDNPNMAEIVTSFQTLSVKYNAK